MICIKYLLGLLFVFLIASSTVFALTTEQQAIIKEKKEKITEKLSEKLADARGTEEYEILVELTDSSASGQFASVMKSYMSSTKRLTHHSLVYAGKADANTIVALMNDYSVKYVELQQEILPSADAVFYNVNATGAPLVWENITGSGVKVAILDTGISSHADLTIAGGTSVISSTYDDVNGHGTQVAGVLAATLNDAGLVGVAPNVNLYAVKIMETNTGNLSDAIDGLQWAINNNMSIVVMSFGFDGFSNIFRDKVNEFYGNGGLLVAAAGNDGGTTVLYPAKYSKVIAVGATDEDNAKVSFSPSSVDMELVAGGVSVNTTSLSNSYASVSGTSFSAPAVAGVIALIWQLDPTLNNTELRTKLHEDALDLGESGKDLSFGYGSVRINTTIGNYSPYLDSYWYEVNTWFENNSQEAYASGYGTFDEVTYEDGRYLVIRKYENGERIYEELRVVGEYQGISALATFNTTITATDDAYVNQTNANQNYGSNTELINWEDVNQVWVFLQYDISSLPSAANVIDADIIVYPTQTPTSDTFTVNNIDASWSESDITWNNRPIGAGTLMTPTITNSDANNDYVIGNGEITTAVSNDKTNNRNSSFQFESGNPTAAIFKSSEAALNKPRLTLVYTDGSVDCNGTMQVQAVDSNSAPMSGLYVRVNGNVNGTTDSLGLRNVDFKPSMCNVAQNLSVYCSDNATFCGNWSHTFTANTRSDFKSKQFTCNMCLQKPELKIGLSDVNVTKKGVGESSLYNISLEIHSENTNQNNVKATFKYQNQLGLIEKETNFTVNVASYSSYTFSETANLNDITYVHFYVDTTNIVKNETSELNNYVLFPVIKTKTLASIDVDTGSSFVDESIINYLQLFVDNVSESKADVIIAIENSNKNPTVQLLNSKTAKKGWKHENGKTYYAGGLIPGGKPYTGLVGYFINDSAINRYYVLAYGDGIEGTIAAVKKLISARTLFLNRNIAQKVVVIDQYDTTGIGVFDVLHNPTNEPVFGKNSAEFGDAIERVLNDNTFELEILTVKEPVQNTTLRLKHENSDYSSAFVNATTQSQQPVVLAHGIHSDLNTWEEFAEDLVEVGFDTWIIEPYGGPTTECSTCPVYTVANLSKNYWPALITGVQNYSGQDDLSYIGYDLGCTIALESLEHYEQGKANAGYVFNTQTGQYVLDSMSSRPIDTFVGLGCLGNFTPSDAYNPKKLPLFTTQINVTNYSAFPISLIYGNHISGNWYKSGDFIVGYSKTGPTETAFEKTIGALLVFLRFSTKVINVASRISIVTGIYALKGESDKNYLPPATTNGLSKGVYEDLQEWMRNSSGPIIGQNVNFTDALIIQARQTQAHQDSVKLFEVKSIETYELYDKDTDGFVSTKDEKEICQNINSNNKYYVEFRDLYHFSSLTKSGLDKDRDVKKAIKDYLQQENITSTSKWTVLSTSGGCE